MNAKTMTLALMTLAGTAMAQPATFTDLGDRTTTQTFTQPVSILSATDIQWYRMVLPPTTASAGYVDIWLTPTANPVPALDMSDTEMGLYDASGNGAVPTIAYNDDDSGPGLMSQLTFGTSTTPRPAITFGTLTVGLARNGVDGNLAGGVYYLAVGRYTVAFATGFSVVSTYTGTQRDAVLNFDIHPPTDPYPPTATGAVTPASTNPGMPVLFTATVVPGGNPASTPITVVGDLTGVGGSATQTFYDDGTHGDATSGDNVFSFGYTLPAASPAGAYTVTLTTSDALARSSTATINGTVAVPPADATDLGVVGSTPVTTTMEFAAPEEIRWLKFTTLADCDAVTNYLDIDTEGSLLVGTGSNPNDTEIGLYRAGGALVASDDDSGSGALSQLTFGATGNPRPAVGNGLAYTGTDGTNGTAVTAGTYYLAVGVFNVNFAASFGVTHTASTITTGSAGPIVVNFNSNLPGGGPACGPADIGSTGGVAGSDNHLDNNDFIVYIDNFFNHLASADVGTTGGVAGSDGAWDNNDFIVFIDQFFNAPASCR